jgi:hypothetical protein
MPSIGILSLLLAMMFKWLPHAGVDRHQVEVGTVITAGLFELERPPSDLHCRAGIGVELRRRGVDYRAVDPGLLDVAGRLRERRSPRLPGA